MGPERAFTWLWWSFNIVEPILPPARAWYGPSHRILRVKVVFAFSVSVPSRHITLACHMLQIMPRQVYFCLPTAHKSFCTPMKTSMNFQNCILIFTGNRFFRVCLVAQKDTVGLCLKDCITTSIPGLQAWFMWQPCLPFILFFIKLKLPTIWTSWSINFMKLMPTVKGTQTKHGDD